MFDTIENYQDAEGQVGMSDGCAERVCKCYLFVLALSLTLTPSLALSLTLTLN